LAACTPDGGRAVGHLGRAEVISLAHFGLILVGAYLTYDLATAWIDRSHGRGDGTAALRRRRRLQWAYDRLNIVEFNSLLVSFGLLMHRHSGGHQRVDRRLPPDVGHGNPYATSARSDRPLVLPTTTLLAPRSRSCSSVADTWCCANTFWGGACAPSPRTAPSRPRSASTTGWDSCSAASPASAAVAGMISRWQQPHSGDRLQWFGTVFAVVILGGIGNLLGTLIAGVGVGLSGLVSVIWSPSTSRSSSSSPSSSLCCGRRAVHPQGAA
jgi:branched-chain amino acid transport system permease protein